MDLIIGIAIGAAFSPFWMMVYEHGKKFVMGQLEKKSDDK